MHKTIVRVAREVSLPPWWVEAIAVEYTDCRDFATRNEIWTFNFDRVSPKTIKDAVGSHHVVVHEPIWHNVQEAVLGHRTIDFLACGVAGIGIPVPLFKESGDAIPEGLLSDRHFHFESNTLDAWDPKLDFLTHFQVLDKGKLWQWHIADLVPVEERHYGKFVSQELDLEPLEEVRQRLAMLRNPVIEPGRPGHEDFKLRVEGFYRWLDEIRRPILSKLEDIHRRKQAASNDSKVTNGVPPPLSRFETFTVRNGEIWTSFSAAPVFFRASREHAAEAEKLASSVHTDMELVDKLDRIYQERASAIVFASSCLEAFINGLMQEHFASLWEAVEHLPVNAKWQLFLELKGKGDVFKPGRQPYQTLLQLVRSRNSLVHFKTDYHKATLHDNGRWVTHTQNHDMPQDLVRELPNKLRELIQELCRAAGIPAPLWLTPQPHLGWLA